MRGAAIYVTLQLLFCEKLYTMYGVAVYSDFLQKQSSPNVLRSIKGFRCAFKPQSTIVPLRIPSPAQETLEQKH